MTDRIAAVITVTAKQWNVPGLAPGFCWRKYGARKSTQPEGSRRAPRRVISNDLCQTPQDRLPSARVAHLARLAIPACRDQPTALQRHTDSVGR